MAATAIGWYGPLIDLAQAASHNGDYVQLLVFVHTSRPIQMLRLRSSEMFLELQQFSSHRCCSWSILMNCLPQRVQRSKNWKLHEERKLQDCTSISEVSGLTDSCNAAFYACIGEIFLPFRLEPDWEFDKEKLFISKRLYSMEDSKIVEDLICTGCKLCGSCIDSGSVDQNKVPLYCQKSSNYIHDVCLIYRPFLLYVWDQSGHIPLLVKNKAAEILFGNIGAESVYKCFQQKEKKGLIPEYGGNARGSTHSKASEGGGAVGVQSSKIDESQQPKSTWLLEDRGQKKKKPDFYSIWLILLKLLLKKGNSPLKFEVVVDCALDEENGRFELANFTMPCDRTNNASD